MGCKARFEVFEGGGYDRRDWDHDTEGTIRIALVGLGGFSRNEVLPAIADCEYVTINATVSGSNKKAREVADVAEADVALRYEEFHQGKDRDAYDAVYVCTPNALHLEHVEAAAELGKDVICEKPMEASIERAEAAVDACANAGVTLMVAYRMQFDPVVRRSRELVADGFIGDVGQVRGSFTFAMFTGRDADPNQWRLDPSLAGGGSLYDIGIYPLNTARFIIDADPVSVQGSVTSPHPQFNGPIIDEHAAFVTEFASGIQALCQSSYGSFGDSYITVAGNEGRITMNNIFLPDAPRTVHLERDGRSARYEGLDVNELTEQFDYFARCCLTGEEPHADGEHGLVDMYTLAGVQMSARDGKRVELD